MVVAQVQRISAVLRSHRGFDRVFDKMRILSASDGNCLAHVKMEHEYTNSMGGLHGGCSAALVKIVSDCAFLTHAKGGIPTESAFLKLTYLKSARKGDELVIDAKTLDVGKTMAHLEVVIKNKLTGELIVTASHSKYLNV